MKKNLLSIIILALLIVNIVLTSIMMFSVVGASKKTSALVTDIASVLNLELSGGTAGTAEAAAEDIPMSQTVVYNIPDPMTISLKKGADGKATWCVVSVALSINNKDKGYKTYYEDLVNTQTLIMSEITDVVGKYTKEEIDSGTEVIDEIRAEILRRVQSNFDSEFIYNISFSDIKTQ